MESRLGIRQAVIIGSGNVATQLALALPMVGTSVVQIFSRRLANAQTLAFRIGADFTDDLAALYPDADLYLYAVADDALPGVIAQTTCSRGIHAHVSGSSPMALFEGKRRHYGVFYPLQTFTKARAVDFKQIPLFIEAADDDTFAALSALGQRLSNSVTALDSRGREQLHIASVFACNFTNYLYTVAEQLLGEHELPFSVIKPLIDESVAKLDHLRPTEAQTGPAMRGDKRIVDRHIAMLAQHSDWQRLYQTISELIAQQHKR